MTNDEAIAFTKGYDLATARAERRQRLGLPIEREPLTVETHGGAVTAWNPKARELPNASGDTIC